MHTKDKFYFSSLLVLLSCGMLFMIFINNHDDQNDSNIISGEYSPISIFNPKSADSTTNLIPPQKIWEYRVGTDSYIYTVDARNDILVYGGPSMYLRCINSTSQNFISSGSYEYNSYMIILNDTLFLLDYQDNDLNSYDLSQSGSLSYIDDSFSISGFDSYHVMTVSEDNAYVSTSEGLYVMNIASPTDIYEMGYYLDEGEIGNVGVQEDLVYMGCTNEKFVIVNASIPNNPVKLGEYQPTTYQSNLASATVLGDLAFFSTNSDFYVLNISEPTSPSVISTYAYQNEGYTRKMVVSDNRVYLCRQENGLLIFDVSNPHNPIPIRYGSRVYDIKIKDYVGYLAAYDNVQIIDLGLDSDADGLTDYQEVEIYGTNRYAADSDFDTLTDDFEIANALDPLNISDAVIDTDGDGLTNLQEMQYDTSINLPDMDNDDLTDYEEVMEYFTVPWISDSDGDMISDGAEILTYNTNPLAQDTDQDGITDYTEIFTVGTDPSNWDTDLDTISDFLEVYHFSSNPFSNDSDQDLLSDYQELYETHTDVNNPDSDGDGLFDYEEFYEYGTNPLWNDTDLDGLSDYEETQWYDTSPFLNDTDADGFADIVEIRWGSDPTNITSFPRSNDDPPEYDIPEDYIDPEQSRLSDEDALNSPEEKRLIFGVAIIFGAVISLVPYAGKFVKEKFSKQS